jgi:oligosaccharide repeat unit polymerase
MPRHAARSGSRTVAIVWILTIIPFGAMAYLVSIFGGLPKYLSQLVIRPLAFQGLNSFMEVAINFISLLTVIYFGVGLIESRGVRWWVFYTTHFMISVAILAMSGSRRPLLMPLIMMLAMYHYFKSEISIRKAGTFLLLLMAITSVEGVLRIGQRGAGSLDRDLSDVERDSVTAHFKYGLVPLEVVLDANVLDLHYGSTFLAAVTNVVPRPLWPGKPDSAGLAITQDYLGNRWLGASYLNAGLLAESIMNFGLTIGLIFSFISLAAAMAYLVLRYRRMMVLLHRRQATVGSVLHMVRYFHIAFAVTGLITWETAIVTIPLILNLSMISVIEFLAKVRRVPISVVATASS